MIVLWMAYAVVVGGLIAVSARAAEEVMRVWRVPARWVWAAALVFQLAVPVTGAWGAGWLTIGAGDGDETIAAPSWLAGMMEDGEFASATAGAVPGEQGSGWLARATLAMGPDRLASYETPVLVGWGLATGGLTLLLLWTLVRAGSERRRWSERRMFGERIRVAPAVGPAVVGVIRPEIVVPDWLLSRPEAELRLALDHEKEHVRAGDPRLLLASAFLPILLPWSPAAWWMFSRMRLAIEVDCDHRVLHAGARRQEYGSLLLDLAERRPAHRLTVATGLIGAPSHLERRIRVMTRTIRFAPARALAFGAAAMAAILAACETGLPTAAEIERMDASVAAEAAQALQLVTDTEGAEARYLVDGEEVAREVAMAIPADEIATINVRGRRIAAVARTADSAGLAGTDDSARAAATVRVPAGPDTLVPTDAVIEIVTHEGVRAGIATASDGELQVAREAAGAAARVDGVTARVDSATVLMLRRASGAEPAVSIEGVRIDPDTRVVTVTPSRAPGDSAGALIVTREVSRRVRPDSGDGVVEVREVATGTPLVFIDGVRREMSARGLSDLAPDGIESIEVIKGAAAVTIYGEEAADGVIRITTKLGAPPQ